MPMPQGEKVCYFVGLDIDDALVRQAFPSFREANAYRDENTGTRLFMTVEFEKRNDGEDH